MWTTTSRDIPFLTNVEEHRRDIIQTEREIEGADSIHVSDRTSLLHSGGKFEIRPKTPIKNRHDFSGFCKGLCTKKVKEAKKLAAAQAIANAIGHDELSEDTIILSVFDKCVADAVASATRRISKKHGRFTGLTHTFVKDSFIDCSQHLEVMRRAAV